MVRGILPALLVCLCWAASVSGQPHCETFYMPDLAPISEVPVTGGIPKGFMVPPTTAETGGFYPFALYSDEHGFVGIDQPDGIGVNLHRRWTGVTSISLVQWFHKNYVAAPQVLRYVQYKTVRNRVPLGSLPLPTWAYRYPGEFEISTMTVNLSYPVQLGEMWNVGIENTTGAWQWTDLQIEGRICQ